jgi:4-diphosphocytidyl-2C-methyl-D-erythritol kinase
VGLSGSGPTLWALYASEAEASASAADVRTALEDGSLVAPGDTPPFITATTIVTHRSEGEPAP